MFGVYKKTVIIVHISSVDQPHKKMGKLIFKHYISSKITINNIHIVYWTNWLASICFPENY